MKRLTDAELDYWYQVYAANPCLRVSGIRFDCFIEMPREILAAQAFGTALPVPDSEDFQSLLPAQERVAQRIAHADMLDGYAEQLEFELIDKLDCCMRGERYVEPLHHHAYSVTNERSVGRR